MARNTAPTPQDIEQANETSPTPPEVLATTGVKAQAEEPPEPVVQPDDQGKPAEPVVQPDDQGKPAEPKVQPDDQGKPLKIGVQPEVNGAPPESALRVQVSASVALASKLIVGLFLGICIVVLVARFGAPAFGGTVFGLAAGRLEAIAFGFGLVGIFLLLLQFLANSRLGGSAESVTESTAAATAGVNDAKRQAGSKPPLPGVFRPIIGADGRFSTSLAQLGIWTLAIGTAMGFLLGRSMFEEIELGQTLPEGTWDDYLILLGGPFAAAVLAKSIVTYKVDAGTLQKSEPAAPAITQVATNDHGSVDLVDSQYLLFNIIALGYFVIEIVNTAVLPTIPPTLLAMTSGTAALYVANKAAQRNAPSITSVTPRTAAPGDLVTILGGNFDPGDRDDRLRRITLAISGYQRTLYPRPTSDTRALFVLPDDVPAGHRTLTLTSSAGVETEAQDIEILPSAVEILEASPPYVQPGERMTLYGRNFRTDQEPRVTVGGVIASDARVQHDGKLLSFTVPRDLPDPSAENVTVVVSFPNLGDATHSFPLERPRIRSAWRASSTTVKVSATGWTRVPFHSRVDPTILVNGIAGTVAETWRDGVDRPLELTVASDVIQGELTLVLIDGLGRESDAYVIAALA